MAHETQRTVSDGLNQGGSLAKRGATRTVSTMGKVAKNTTKMAVKTAKNIAKQGVKGGLKATVESTKIFALLTNPVGLAILGVFLLIVIIIGVSAHEPSTERNYRNDAIRLKNSYVSPTVSSTVSVDYEEAEEDTDNPNEGYFLDDTLTEYDGTAFIGQPTKQYKEYFQSTFQRVFDKLCRLEVETVIEERGYDYLATIDSYNKNESPFMDINYAEIICVMSQNENFTLDNGSLTEIMDWLKDETHLQYLYYMTVEEKLGYKQLWSETKVYNASDYPYSVKEEGAILEEEKINVKLPFIGHSSVMSWFMEKFASPSKLTLRAYAKEVENNEFEEVNGYITNGRTVISPTNETSSWKFTTTLTKHTSISTPIITVVTVTQEEFNSSYDSNKYAYDPKTGHVFIRGSGFPLITQTYTNVEMYEVTESLDSTYLYGDVKLMPYSLADLYNCFEVDYTASSYDHGDINNLVMLDEQEYFLRNYIEDDEELLGTNAERTEMYSAYDMLFDNAISEANLNLSTYIYSGDLSAYQENLWTVVRSITGEHSIKYGASFGGFSSFMCSPFAYWVSSKAGIEPFPKNMPSDGCEKIGLSPKADIRVRCTLMCYYIRNYQPQAIVSYAYDESVMECGDLVYILYDSSFLNRKETFNIPNEDKRKYYSDHVFVYMGDGYMAESAGGRLQKTAVSKVSQKYKNTTFLVYRPALAKGIR